MGYHRPHLHLRDVSAPQSSRPTVGLRKLQPDGDSRSKAELLKETIPIAGGATIEQQLVAPRQRPPPIEAILIGGLIAASIANALLLLTG